MNGTTMVYGNLALKPLPTRGELTVIDGSASRTMPARIEEAPAGSAARATLARSIAYAAASILLVAACASIAWGIPALRAAAASRALDAASVETVEVLPGESLWGIAEAHPVEGLSAPEHVSAIKRLNGLENGTLHPGMELAVPTTMG